MLSSATIWMNLEGIILSKISQRMNVTGNEYTTLT